MCTNQSKVLVEWSVLATGMKISRLLIKGPEKKDECGDVIYKYIEKNVRHVTRNNVKYLYENVHINR